MKKKSKLKRYAPLDPPNQNQSWHYIPQTIYKLGQVQMEVHSGYVWIARGGKSGPCIEIPVKDFKRLISWAQRKQKVYRWDEGYRTVEGRLKKARQSLP